MPATPKSIMQTSSVFPAKSVLEAAMVARKRRPIVSVVGSSVAAAAAVLAVLVASPILTREDAVGQSSSIRLYDSMAAM